MDSPCTTPAARTAVAALAAFTSLAAALPACSCGAKGQPSAPGAAESAPAPSIAALTPSDLRGLAAREAGAPRAGDASATATSPSAQWPAPDAGASRVLRFAVLGDTGMGNAGQRKVAEALARKCAADGCDMVWLLGDNFYRSGVASVTDPLWKERFEDMYAATKVDFFAVLGNHDYGGNGAGTDFERAQAEVDYTQRSSRWKMPARHYRVRRGPVELFGLDSNAQMWGKDEAQRADVPRWIAESGARWKVAAAHHPYRSNGPHGNAGSYDGLAHVPVASGKGVKSFDDDVICGKVDLLMTGHDHTRQWIKETCQGTELIVSGTGAEGTRLVGSNETWFQTVRLGLVYVVIDGGKLTADFIDEDGKTEFSRTIERP